MPKIGQSALSLIKTFICGCPVTRLLSHAFPDGTVRLEAPRHAHEICHRHSDEQSGSQGIQLVLGATMTSFTVTLVLVFGIAIISITFLAVLILIGTGTLRDLLFVAEVVRAFRAK